MVKHATSFSLIECNCNLLAYPASTSRRPRHGARALSSLSLRPCGKARAPLGADPTWRAASRSPPLAPSRPVSSRFLSRGARYGGQGRRDEAITWAPVRENRQAVTWNELGHSFNLARDLSVNLKKIETLPVVVALASDRLT